MHAGSILVCEDDVRISELLVEALQKDGYQVRAAGTMREAIYLLKSWVPDLILLDIILPESNDAGWDLLRWIRDRSLVPIILVSALSRAADRVRGLRAGADDFISKPFQLDEVLARVEAILRRTQPKISELRLDVDDLRKQVIYKDKKVKLSPKEYRLLKLLVSSPGRVFTHQEILTELWPPDPETGGKTYANAQDVQKYVYLLRKKLEVDPQEPTLVVTVRGFGYRLDV